MRNAIIFTVALILSLLMLDFVAYAAPRARNALRLAQGERIVYVAVTSDGGRHERAVGLRHVPNGWRLELADAEPVGSAQIHDVTSGAVSSKWVVGIERNQLVLDETRFVAGHAYRVELASGSLLVYLYPPPAGARRTRVSFDETPSDAGEDGIAITPKSAL